MMMKTLTLLVTLLMCFNLFAQDRVYVYSCDGINTNVPTRLFIQYDNTLFGIVELKQVVISEGENSTMYDRSRMLDFYFTETSNDPYDLDDALDITIKNKEGSIIASIEIDAPVLPLNKVKAVYSDFVENRTLYFNCSLTHH